MDKITELLETYIKKENFVGLIVFGTIGAIAYATKPNKTSLLITLTNRLNDINDNSDPLERMMSDPTIPHTMYSDLIESRRNGNYRGLPKLNPSDLEMHVNVNNYIIYNTARVMAGSDDDDGHYIGLFNKWIKIS